MLVGYRRLVRVTEQVCAVWGHGPVRVEPLPEGRQGCYWGDADLSRRVVRYARRAPLDTVAHELAHLVAAGPVHGPEWRAQYAYLATLVAAL